MSGFFAWAVPCESFLDSWLGLGMVGLMVWIDSFLSCLQPRVLTTIPMPHSLTRGYHLWSDSGSAVLLTTLDASINCICLGALQKVGFVFS